jgi:hypothetical protein
MSQLRPAPGFGTYAFELTEDEARIAAARSGPPAIAPVRVLAGAEAAAGFVEFLRARLPRRLAAPAPGR